ncbi:MAG: co-chaperone GroES [Dehalococcoidia bacterium]
MATNVIPMTDHIVLQPVEQEEISAFGLVIPDSAKEKPQHGHVIAVGPGKRNEKGDLDAIELASGDRILYQKYTGQEVSVDTQDYIIIRFQDVLAKLEDGASASKATSKGAFKAGPKAKAAPKAAAKKPARR